MLFRSNMRNETSTYLWLGSLTSGTTYRLNGWMDEVRLTVGSDRGYTGSTIDVPTAAFPNP